MTDVTRAYILRAVAARGYTVTAYQWRVWKEAGLIPSAQRETLGYKQGVIGMYPLEVVEIVTRLAATSTRSKDPRS